MKISGNLTDLYQNRIYPAEVIWNDAGTITEINEIRDAPAHYIMPGFVDAHIHIESSMLVPYEFARVALKHGTVATVSDPHEIANVLGVDGVMYMIENAKDARLKFHFGAPSCVPATQYETAGAIIDSNQVHSLLKNPDIFYLSEMMNYPGVLNSDPEVLAKIASARSLNKKIDGHAPGLRGTQAESYIKSGISTDHECFTIEEALEKLHYGMKIIIREGSAARNFDVLHPLIASHPDKLMFCSDDKHPDELLKGHINTLAIRALDLGYNFFEVLRIACINPVNHYGLKVGTLKVGDPADFILVDNPENLKVKATYINGAMVFGNNKIFLPPKSHACPNNFNIDHISENEITIKGAGVNVPVIIPVDGSLITEKFFTDMNTVNANIIADPDDDILKICVVNRYKKAKVACGFIKGFGLKDCAIASTVAHDSHNIIATGSSDNLIIKAINALVKTKGGLALITHDYEEVLPLPVAGLMSAEDGETVGRQYFQIDRMVKEMGCELNAPFMTLSFMALLVIPKIKISDKGMFDAEAFRFYD